MKLPAKSISSPGRSDKFPPPLMRFLRSNVGSKSRARIRSSPMFVRKKNTTAVETQEPSSPKVTCMGQVRVRRASSSAASSRPGRVRRAAAPTRKRFGWIQNAVFCSDFPGKIKPKSSCGDLWRKWVPFFQAGFCSKAQIEEEPVKIETRFGEEAQRSCSDEEEQEEQEFERKAKAFAFAASSSSPPKNALLLTRCRSAPYRSSSLACRFWGSPNRAEEETGEEEKEEEQSKTGEEEQEQSIENGSENERPTSEGESISDRESRTEKQNEEKIEFFKGLENSIRERMAKSASIEDLKEGEFGSESARPLILTRCKSEPARTAAEKLDPDSLIHSHQVFVIN